MTMPNARKLRLNDVPYSYVIKRLESPVHNSMVRVVVEMPKQYLTTVWTSPYDKAAFTPALVRFLIKHEHDEDEGPVQLPLRLDSDDGWKLKDVSRVRRLNKRQAGQSRSKAS